MKRVMTRTQIQIIMILNAVILVMICGIIYMFSSPTTTAVSGGGNAEKPHSIIRDARLSANSDIAWETNIGGSGNETLCSAYPCGDGFAVFFATDSSDKDLSGTGAGCAAKIGANGKTETFVPLSVTPKKVLPTHSGFAVMGDGANGVKLMLLDANLTLTSEVTLDNTYPVTALDMFIYDNRYMIVTNYKNASLNKNQFIVYAVTPALQTEYTRVITRAYDLSYVTLLPSTNGNYYMAINITNSKTPFFAVAKFSKTTDVTYFDYDKCLNYEYRCDAFMPYADGYAALIYGDNRSDFLLIDSALSETGTAFVMLPGGFAEMKISGGLPYLLAGGGLIRFDDALKNKTEIESGITEALYDVRTTQSAVIIAGAGDTLAFTLLSNSSSEVKQVAAASDKQYGAIVLPSSDGFVAVCMSDAECGDVGGHFGGSDIWIAKFTV